MNREPPSVRWYEFVALVGVVAAILVLFFAAVFGTTKVVGEVWCDLKVDRPVVVEADYHMTLDDSECALTLGDGRVIYRDPLQSLGDTNEVRR